MDTLTACPQDLAAALRNGGDGVVNAELGGWAGNRATMAAIGRYNAEKARTFVQGRVTIERYVAMTAEECGTEHGEEWSFADHSRRCSWGGHRQLKHAHFGMGHVLRYILRKEPRNAAVQAIQSLESYRQAALDDGSWKIAHPLSLLPPMNAAKRFAGTEQELEVTAGYVTSCDKLAATIAGSRQTAPLIEEVEEVEEGGTPHPKAKAARKKKPP